MVDITTEADVEIRGYLAEGYKDATFNIGRVVDTGPGDVGEEIVDPPASGISRDNVGFPRGSRVSYYNNVDTHKRIDVILEGANEKKECIGAFYLTANTPSNYIKITAITRAAGGN